VRSLNLFRRTLLAAFCFAAGAMLGIPSFAQQAKLQKLTWDIQFIRIHQWERDGHWPRHFTLHHRGPRGGSPGPQITRSSELRSAYCSEVLMPPRT